MTNPRLVKPLAQFIPRLSSSAAASRALYLAAPTRSFPSPCSSSMGFFRNIFSGPPSPGTMANSKTKVQDIIDNNAVVVFSKSYCPYCTRAKHALKGLDLETEPYVLELDHEDDGSDLQAALLELTGQRTVPNIFIGKEHVGGSDDLSSLLKNKGQLNTLLEKAFPQ